MSILELDVGNTRLKWRLRSGDDELAYGEVVRLGREDADVIGMMFESLSGAVVTDVRVASVADRAFSILLRRLFQAEGLPEPLFARVTASSDGVVCAYGDVSSLGVDRWLAVLASRGVCPDGAVVVDCGSAVTVDVICNAEHIGGYIVPGLRLMVSALFQGTDRVKVERSFDDKLVPAKSTGAAVNRGVVLMVLGLIDQVVGEVAHRFDGVVPVVLTGGDSSAFAELIERRLVGVEVVESSSLVMDGLRRCSLSPLGGCEEVL